MSRTCLQVVTAHPGELGWGRDPDRAEVSLATQVVFETLQSQLASHVGVHDLLRERLGDDEYDAVLLDLARNVVQGLL